MELLQVIEKVHAEANSKNEPEMRFIQAIKPGQVVRQGDIYLVCVESSHPKGNRIKDSQLAPGTSKGSRHVAGEGFELYEGKKAPAGWMEKINNGQRADKLEALLTGPRMFTKKRAIVAHPEHAHVSLPGGCDVQVMFQLNPRTMKRVED